MQKIIITIPKHRGNDFEKALITRIKNYEDNYFAWIRNFDLPTMNNLSERNLRCIKTHQKVSGQFQNIAHAQNFAIIKSYIETAKKNGFNEIFALNRLAELNPLTVKEIFQ